MIPNSGYDDSEIAYPDKFISPYVGKTYVDDWTEVISMGIERFADADSMALLYGKDPDHFNLILGILQND